MSLSAEAINDALKKHKGKRAAARALGVPYSTLWHAMRADASAFTSRLTVNKVHFDGPKRGVKRFIFSCAQAERKAKEAAGLKAKNAPDKEKLLAFVETLKWLPLPELQGQAAKDILGEAILNITLVYAAIEVS